MEEAHKSLDPEKYVLAAQNEESSPCLTPELSDETGESSSFPTYYIHIFYKCAYIAVYLYNYLKINTIFIASLSLRLCKFKAKFWNNQIKTNKNNPFNDFKHLRLEVLNLLTFEAK